MDLVYTLSLILLVFDLWTVDSAPFSRCPFGQYWNKVLEICRPCGDVCEPLSRPSCLQLCTDYFMTETYKTTTTTTKTTTEQNIARLTQVGDPETLPDHINITNIVVLIAGLAIIAAVIIIIVKLNSTNSQRLRHFRGHGGANPGATDGNRCSERRPLNRGQGQEHLVAQVHTDRETDDGRKREWSGRAVYDDKNKCIEIKGMDKFPTGDYKQSHSV